MLAVVVFHVVPCGTVRYGIGVDRRVSSLVASEKALLLEFRIEEDTGLKDRRGRGRMGLTFLLGIEEITDEDQLLTCFIITNL